MAVLELPPRFSRSSQVSTESRYGMKSAFFDFLLFDACGGRLVVMGCRKLIKYLVKLVIYVGDLMSNFLAIIIPLIQYYINYLVSPAGIYRQRV